MKGMLITSEPTVSEDSEGRRHEVERQLDGLPCLPSHLDFAQHYSADHHCPVCSLGA
jgi:hypothetical protein